METNFEDFKPTTNTPNLDHNLKSLFGKKRVKWDKKIDFEYFTTLHEFDISGTFLENIPNIICATAMKISDRKLQLSLYRFDKKDLRNEGNPINIDQYIIEEEIHKSCYFPTTLKSTEENENMKQTLLKNDLYIKQKEENIENHHTKDLPKEVQSILNIYKENYLTLFKGGSPRQNNS